MGPHPPSIAIEESVEINLLALEALLSKPFVKVSLLGLDRPLWFWSCVIAFMVCLLSLRGVVFGAEVS